MRRMLWLFVLLSAIIFCGNVSAQEIIKGSVVNGGTGLPLPAVSITVSGSGEGTFTDDNGNFTLRVNVPFPVTLDFSSIGFESTTQVVSAPSEEVLVTMSPAAILGQEIVVSATRTPARIMEAPVTIETITDRQMVNATSPGYYDMIAKLKGVDMVNSSLTFSSPSTRGFNGSGNLRLNQIMDGMDNQAPGLNFAVGSFIGLTQLDIASVELLPGASSALYGPGGMNGALLINGKDPFRYQGLSFDIKTGIMNLKNEARSPSAYYDWTFRYAKQVSQKFAFKIGGQLIQAKDWVAQDYRNYSRTGNTGHLIPGTRETDPNYDGVNVYGDETTADIMDKVLKPLAQKAPFYAPYVDALPASIPVSRTGYMEKDVIDPNTIDFKANAQLSYKLSNWTQMNLAGFFGTGNSVYTGSDRYSLMNLKMAQYKLEVVNPNWFVRAWTTQENAGESFNATVTTRITNEAWKPSASSDSLRPELGWYYQYALAFLNNKMSGLSDIDAHDQARAYADQGRPEAGSQQFKDIFDQVRKIPISQGGGLFVDKTNLYDLEGQYNFSEKTHDVVDLIIGGDYKRFVLNSQGTLFADSAGKIPINEFGLYLQATRKLINDYLTIIASGRYDKNENFDGRFTPRVSFVIKLAEDNNLRLSYQQAYRFGSTQQQWINLDVGGGAILVGGVHNFWDFYHFDTNPLYSVNDALFAGNPQQFPLKKFKAETVNSFEGGYKGLLANKRLLIDLYGYFGIYKNFITRPTMVQAVGGDPSIFTDPATVQGVLSDRSKSVVFSVPQNLDGNVQTYGYGLSLTYLFPRNFEIMAQGSSDHLDKVPAGFPSGFNAPKYRAGATFSNSGFGHQNRFGFNISYRWQDEVVYESDFVNGVFPAFQALDAQINYKLPAEKILFKLGGTNILNQYYINGMGNPAIGGLYYFSIGYNLF